MKSFFLNQKNILILVFLNLVVILMVGFFPNDYVLFYIDAFFTILFVVEAIFKISYYGFKNYWSDNWNKFDFIVTLLAVPSSANLFVDSHFATTNVLLSLRTLRVFKSFLLIRFIPNIDKLITGVKLACKASLMVIMGFTVLMLVTSIITSALFGEIVPEMFGNPAKSIYTTFRLFSVEGWYDIPDLIASRSSVGYAVFAKIYFCFLLFTGGIIGMSLINSIFVDAMVADNNDEVLDKLNEIEEKINKLSDK